MQVDLYRNLRSSIDSARLLQSWDTVKTLLEDVWSIIESGANDHTLGELESYYCICSAELAFHHNNDLSSAIRFLRRGCGFNAIDPHLRIVAVRILLITCRTSICAISARHDLTQYYRDISLNGGDLSLSPTITLDLPDVIQSSTNSMLEKLSTVERCCIISILEIFPAMEIVSILKACSDYFRANTQRDQHIFFILLIANHLLLEIDISTTLHGYLSGECTSYFYWLVLDSILARATIAELFGDVGIVLTLMKTVKECHQQVDLTSMDKRCLDQVLLCVSKLPILYAENKLFSQSSVIFNQCFFDDGKWSSLLPMKVKVGICAKVALQFLCSCGEEDASMVSRDVIFEAGKYLAFIWSKINQDKAASVNALSQSGHTLNSLPISCLNVLSNGDMSVSFIVSNFDVSSIGILLAAIIRYSFVHLDLRLTPAALLSQELETNISPSNVNDGVHEVIEWGYQLALKPTIPSMWNMSSSCILHCKDPQRSVELMYRCHEQLSKSLNQYFRDNKNNIDSYSPLQRMVANAEAMRQIFSLEDRELVQGLRALQFSIPQRFVEDPWAPLVKYAEIVIAHSCPVTHSSYHQSGIFGHWSPTTVELESTIQHLLDGFRQFTGSKFWSELLVGQLGIVNGQWIHTIQHLLNDQGIRDGIGEKLYCDHYFHSELELRDALPSRLEHFTEHMSRHDYLNLELQQYPSYHSSLVGILTILLQLGRVMYHYALHSSLPRQLTRQIQIMATKLLSYILSTVEPLLRLSPVASSRNMTHKEIISIQTAELMDLKLASSFYLAMLFLQVQLPQLASKLIRDVIGSLTQHNHSAWAMLKIRFLHLLSLSMSAGDGADDPKILGATIALLQKSIGKHVLFGQDSTNVSDDPEPPILSVPDNFILLNERHTALLLVLQSGESALAYTIAERLVQNIHHFLQRYEAHQEATMQDISRTAPSHVSGTASNALVASKLSFLSTILPDVGYHSNALLMMVKLLYQIAKVCIRLNQLTLAKQAMAIAWKSLYTVDAATTMRLQKRKQAPGILPEQLVHRMTSGKKSFDSMSTTHDEIDALRYLPTLLGWRLSEGYGWAIKHHRDLEAALLCTCAHIVQQETGIIDDSRAVGLLHLALSHDPQNVETLNALANVSLSLYEKDILRSSAFAKEDSEDVDGVDSNSYGYLSQQYPQVTSPHLALALLYIRSALSVNYRSVDSWQLMSAIQRAMQQHESSQESVILSLECQLDVPIRCASVVLW